MKKGYIISEEEYKTIYKELLDAEIETQRLLKNYEKSEIVYYEVVKLMRKLLFIKKRFEGKL